MRSQKHDGRKLLRVIVPGHRLPLLLGGVGIGWGLLSIPLSKESHLARSGLTQTEPAQAEYKKWVQRYRTKPPSIRFPEGLTPLKLVLTIITGDEPQPDNAMPAVLYKTVSSGCQVSVTGRIHYFSHSAFGHKGSGYPQLPQQDLKRLEQLLTQLPDDGSRLPPPGRRLVVQFTTVPSATAPSTAVQSPAAQSTAEDSFRVRVYDRANTPAVVLEILRLTGSGIRSWLPEFRPDNEWKAHDHYEGALTLAPGLPLSPDRLIISTTMHGPLRFWNSGTRKLVKEISLPGNIAVTGIGFSPDGALAVVEGGGDIAVLDTRTWGLIRVLSEPLVGDVRAGLSHPQFTADGRFLLVQTSKPALIIYDCRTWKRQTRLPGVPQDAIAYLVGPGAKRSISVSKTGSLILWDAQQNRPVVTLDKAARLHQVAFSPDQSRIAIATQHQGPGGYWTIYRLRIWKADTGVLVHELKPFEQSTCEGVAGLHWTPDGQYVLAATKAHGFFTSWGIGVWSVKSGRHRGELRGCPTQVTGLERLADGRLVAGCEDDKIRIWNTAPILQKITAFERSLIPTKHQ